MKIVLITDVDPGTCPDCTETGIDHYQLGDK